MSSDAITALLIFGATQTGALIFFAGVVAFTLKSHGERLGTGEVALSKVSDRVAQLLGREGISL